MYETNRANPNPKSNPKPIRPKQPMDIVSPFVPYMECVCVNSLFEKVVRSTGFWGGGKFEIVWDTCRTALSQLVLRITGAVC